MKHISGMAYSQEELISMLRQDVEEIIYEYDIDACIEELWLHGSRIRGTNRIDSDLDVVVFYKGEEREDDFFNILHEDQITIDGVDIDFNPVRINTDNDISNYKKKSYEYDKEILHGKTFEKHNHNMNNVKTYSDMLNDRELDKKALELFNELYEKLNNLSEKELKYIKESIKTEEVVSVDSLNTDIEKTQNEGFFGGATGLIGGLIAGDKLGKAICQALGVTTGPLYSLLTSKIVVTAIATYLGIKM